MFFVKYTVCYENENKKYCIAWHIWKTHSEIGTAVTLNNSHSNINLKLFL